jgi:similar to stage IV sporulation protein
MKSNFVNYLHGYVKIRIYGKMPEKFINLCTANYIILWDIYKEGTGETIVATMRLADFLRIRPIVLKAPVHICVISYGGVPFILKRLKRRRMLPLGIFLFIIVLNILTSYIWFIDITGTKQLPPDRIKEIAYQYGLKPGIMKDTLDIKVIENKMLLSLPEISWIGINFMGTHATIEVVEKTMPKIEDKLPADIIAGKDGIIVELIALAGQPVVKAGDTVKKGDILIKGITPAVCPPNLEQTNSPQTKGLPQPVKANGIVKARVWYEGYGEEALTSILYTRTGKECMSITIKLGTKELLIKKSPQNPYDAFEVEVIHKNLDFWRNSVFTVESIISIYHELWAEKREMTAEEARDKAKSKAFSVLKNFIPESAYILDQSTEVLKTSQPNLIRIKVNVETIEDIGQNIGIK